MTFPFSLASSQKENRHADDGTTGICSGLTENRQPGGESERPRKAAKCTGVGQPVANSNSPKAVRNGAKPRASFHRRFLRFLVSLQNLVNMWFANTSWKSEGRCWNRGTQYAREIFSSGPVASPGTWPASSSFLTLPHLGTGPGRLRVSDLPRATTSWHALLRHAQGRQLHRANSADCSRFSLCYDCNFLPSP